LVIFAVVVLAAVTLGFIIGCCIVPVRRRKERPDTETLLSDSAHSDPDSPHREYAKRDSSGPLSFGAPEIPGPGRAFMFA
jgi:hypothetical protein